MLNVLHVVQPLCVPPEAQFALNGNGQVQETRCTKKNKKKTKHKHQTELCAAALCQPDNPIVVLGTQSDTFTLSPLVQLCPTGLSTKCKMFEVLTSSRREEDNHIYFICCFISLPILPIEGDRQKWSDRESEFVKFLLTPLAVGFEGWGRLIFFFNGAMNRFFIGLKCWKWVWVSFCLSLNSPHLLGLA